MVLANTMKQAFLAQAAGDALGYPLEFGSGKYSEFLKVYENPNRRLVITDDTQMALFGAYALYESKANGVSEDKARLEVVKNNYLMWYRTQQYKKSHLYSSKRHPLFVPEMMAVRAPGNTCLSSMDSWGKGVLPVNDSKGNGAVMRTLPFVFSPEILGISEDQGCELAVKASLLTHSHSESEHATKAYYRMGRCLLNGVSQKNVGSVLIRKAGFYVFDYFDLGQYTGGNTFTAGPALLKAVTGLILSGSNFHRLMAYCICHDGDSDTIAAIAGGLYGIVYSAPEDIVRRVVEADIILKTISLFKEADHEGVV
jgi:ADP-ribosylglycohydrolase